jgi:hypothetical protein
LKRRMRLPEVGLHHPHPVVKDGQDLLDLEVLWLFCGLGDSGDPGSKGLVDLASEHVGLPDGMV